MAGRYPVDLLLSGLLLSPAACGRLYTHNPQEIVAYDYPSAELPPGEMETVGTPRRWKDPYVQRVDLLPGRTIFASPDQSFDMFARVTGIGFYSGNDPFPIPYGDNTFGEIPDLAWASSALLQGQTHPNDGYRFTVRIPSAAALATIPQQRFGLVSATLENAHIGLDDFRPGFVIVGVLAEVNPYWDHVTADPVGSTLPGVALIDGLTLWGCRNDMPLAFAGLGRTGPYTGDCPASTDPAITDPGLEGSAALFSARRRVVWADVSWGSGCDWLDFRVAPTGGAPTGCVRRPVFDAQGPAGPTAVLDIPVRVWKHVETKSGTGSTRTIPVSLEHVKQASDEDLATLTAIMAENLGGMSFTAVEYVELDGDYTIDLPFEQGVGAAIRQECTSSPVALILAGQSSGAQIPDTPNLLVQNLLSRDLTDAINLVYVQGISRPRAFACRGDETGLVFVSWRDRKPTLVAHEIGHALSLVPPLDPNDPEAPAPDAVGHTDELPEFAPRNLMYGYEDDRVSEDRHHLSLGQVFRMSLSHRSWIHRRMSDIPYLPAIECQETYDTDLPCPLLYQDHLYLEVP